MMKEAYAKDLINQYAGEFLEGEDLSDDELDMMIEYLRKKWENNNDA
jgi:hypothetical protein